MTTEKLTKRLEMGAYAAIIVMALITSAVLVNKYFLTKGVKMVSDQQTPPIRKGERVSIPNQDWEKNGRTLLLALSTNCKFCTESAPFYRRLVAETASAKNLHIAAIFPQSVEESRTYLSNLGVAVADVQQLSGQSLEVRATPTLILLNEKGAVLESWTGKVSASDEQAVVATVLANIK
jgi:thioredoxin-related protein